MEITEETKSQPIFTKPSQQVECDSSSDEYEYEEYSSDDEGTAFALRHRPVFISKVVDGCEHDDQADRKTVTDPEVEALREKQAEEEEEAKRQRRHEEVIKDMHDYAKTQKMIMEANLREIEERENQGKKKDPHTLEEIPDDTDDLTDEAEIQAWKQREFERIMRERVKEEARQEVGSLAVGEA